MITQILYFFDFFTLEILLNNKIIVFLIEKFFDFFQKLCDHFPIFRYYIGEQPNQ